VGVGVVLSQGTGWKRIPVWYVVRVSTRNLEMVYTPSVCSWNGIPFSYRNEISVGRMSRSLCRRVTDRQDSAHFSRVYENVKLLLLSRVVEWSKGGKD
jgi:hypothetical protein